MIAARALAALALITTLTAAAVHIGQTVAAAIPTDPNTLPAYLALTTTGVIGAWLIAVGLIHHRSIR